MGYSPWGRKESDMTERLYLLTDLIGNQVLPLLTGLSPNCKNAAASGQEGGDGSLHLLPTLGERPLNTLILLT